MSIVAAFDSNQLFDPNETYALTATGMIHRGSDGAYIPPDPENRDYRAYQAWVAAGGVATPYTPPPPVYSCQLWQLQASLTADQWTQVLNVIAAKNDPVLTAFSQHGTNVIPSNSTTLISLGAAIGLSPSQVTALVQQASLIAIP